MVTAFGASAGVASEENRAVTHHFSLGADLVLFGGICLYIATKTAQQSIVETALGNVYKWGPLVFAVFGSILMLLDVSRHVLLDHDGWLWQPATLAMYSDEGGLSPVGKFCQVSTIMGLIFLNAGVVCFLQLPARIYVFCGQRDQGKEAKATQ